MALVIPISIALNVHATKRAPTQDASPVQCHRSGDAAVEPTVREALQSNIRAKRPPSLAES